MSNKPQKILLIDDSTTIRKSAEILLKLTGRDVVLAEDGMSGLSCAIKERPDLIFIDVMMPHLDGFHVCAAIRNIPFLKKTPVVMLTSKETLQDRAKGEMVGANIYLAKPFNKQTLVEAVESLL